MAKKLVTSKVVARIVGRSLAEQIVRDYQEQHLINGGRTEDMHPWNNELWTVLPSIFSALAGTKRLRVVMEESVRNRFRERGY